MARTLPTIFAFSAMLCCGAPAAESSSGAYPRIDAMDWHGAEFVCSAWLAEQGAEAKQPVWTGLPAAVKPFGMRAYVRIDGMVRPLRQIAYAHSDRALAIHYRTLGERAFDVRLELSGLDPGGLKGAALTGTLTVSRYGLFTKVSLAGACGLPSRS